jgi:YVTN family beta-propeller protein
VNPLTNTIYVANFLDKSVSVIDGTTNVVKATVKVGNSATNVRVDSATNLIYVNINSDNFVSLNSDNSTTPNNAEAVINGETNTLIKTIENISNGSLLSIDPVMNRIFVVGHLYGDQSNTLSEIDGKANIVTRTLNSRAYDTAINNPLMVGLVVDPTNNRLYIADVGYGGIYAHISVIDEKTSTVIAPIDGPIVVGDLAINPITNRLYAIGRHGGGVSVINANTGNYVTTINLDEPLESIAVNPNTNTIYVDSYSNSTLSEISGATNKVIARQNMIDRPGTLAVNPVTNTIYLANRDKNTVSVLREDSLPTFTPTYALGALTLTPHERGGS